MSTTSDDRIILSRESYILRDDFDLAKSFYINGMHCDTIYDILQPSMSLYTFKWGVPPLFNIDKEKRKKAVFFYTYGWSYDDRTLIDVCEKLYLDGNTVEDIISITDLNMTKRMFMSRIYLKFKSDSEVLQRVARKRKNLAISKFMLANPNDLHLISYKRFKYTRECKVCGNVHKSNIESDLCYRHEKYRDRWKKFEGKKEGVDYVLCPYCTYPFESLNEQHLGVHKKTKKDLYTDHPGYKSHCDTLYERTGLSDYHKGSVTRGKRGLKGKKCRYERVDGVSHVFKSTWELEFAKYLDDEEYVWEYEPESFSYRGTDDSHRSYTPDFYIKGRDIYYEVKPLQVIRMFRGTVRNKALSVLSRGHEYYFVTERSLFTLREHGLDTVVSDTKDIFEELGITSVC